MDKAIKMLTGIKNASSVLGIRLGEIDEALAELLETQAKLESLREYYREQIDNINKIGDLDIIDVMKRTIYRDMLNKLEKGEKVQ